MTRTVNLTLPRAVDGRLAGLSRWLWPARCLVCLEAGSAGRDACRDCVDGLPWNRSACLRCAMPLPPVPVAETPLPAQTCGACLKRPPPLTEAHAAFVYAAPLDRLLPRLKFHHDLAAGRLLAQWMGDAFARRSRHWTETATLVPIPLHRSRLRRRGYDQALELARPLARSLALPLDADALFRRRDTAPQSRLDAPQRRRNLAGAFAVREDHPLPAHVVLVDDVMTTGTTLRAAAIALRRAGVARVDAWVCARVP